MISGSANPLVSAGIAGLHSLIAARDVSPVEVLEAHMARIERLNPALNCVVALDEARARASAHDSAMRFARGGSLGILDGVPILLKANIAIENLAWTNGLLAWRERIATHDAFVTRRLRAAGAVVLGHVSMHEAALGATNFSPLYGQAYNPARLGFTPGGSSGGSAAAVAAALSPGALGTDTMGSVRIPSAYCGVVGFKPSFGRVSCSGVSALSPSLDHVGVHARSVEDAAALFAAIEGFDASDPYSTPADPLVLGHAALEGLRIGVLEHRDEFACDAPVDAAWSDAIAALDRAGARVTPCALEDYRYVEALHHGLLMCEADLAALLTDAEQAPEMLSPMLSAMLGFGQRQSAPKLARAQLGVARARVAARKAFSDFDVLVSPTAPQTAFKADEPAPPTQALFTAFANFSRCPAISIPLPVPADALPVGLQIMAGFGEDARLLAVAKAIERLWRE